MAKWSRDWPGQSGHLHASLKDLRTGKGAFYDPEAKHNMSEAMRWFVGGQQQLMPEILAMAAASAIYGLMSAAATRYSTRCDFSEPGMTRSAVVRFSTPQAESVGAQKPGISRV